MNILDKKVSHYKYGDGQISEIKGNYIYVSFNKKKKKFLFPMCFYDHYLETNDEDIIKLISQKELIKQHISTFDKLIKKDTYISRKEFNKELQEFDNLLQELNDSSKMGLLKEYCDKYDLDINSVKKGLDIYNHIDEYVKKHNDEYVNIHLQKDKWYLDEILKEDDPKIQLDEDQRKVVLTDEDYCLVIAGAGAGKTTTIAAKVKYLVDVKKVDPKKILVISFTNKAVDELKERINLKLKIDCPVTTFHASGNAIIRKTQDQKLKIYPEGALYNIVRNYIHQNIFKDKQILKSLILFFGYYIDAPFEGKKVEDFLQYKEYADFSTLKSNLGEINQQIIDSRKKIKKTINNEIVNSLEEVQIANFLYLNGIDYEYEKAYPYNIPGATKIYTPDFYIIQDDLKLYLEHFGISEDGKSSKYSELELIKYKGQIADKLLIHQKHNTKLITTYSKYNDGRSLLEHLQEELNKVGVVFNKKSDEEIYVKLSKIEDNKYFDKLVLLIHKFIHNFKTKDYSASDFTTLRNSTDNVRIKLFLDICEKAYLDYQRILKENNAVDFEDMINESSKLLREVKELKQKLGFEYIIVDEYQDISRQRFNLTKELSDVTDGKIIAVGDDWQSIYAFAGSEIELFTKFKQEMGYAEVLQITRTYRNSQELIDIAGKFVQENPSQIRKRLISPKSIVKPVVIFTYDDEPKKGVGRKGVVAEKAKLLEETIDKVLKTCSKTASILVLGRYNFDGMWLGRTPYFDYDEKHRKLVSKKYPDLNLTFMTVHSAKGLTYDNVIIVNATNEIYGFPAQIENDPVLNLVIHNDRSYEYAEERRLFYVALTRTRNRVFILAPTNKPSKFVLELLQYDNVTLHGKINKNYVEIKKFAKVCPVCGYPMHLKANKTYGLKLYMCTNDPEICDFMTNDIHGGSNSIRICPDCQGGFLIIKKRKNEDSYFLGCTNYEEKHGCTHVDPLKF